MLEKYYTFIIVRDPIERILSAYKDKAFDEFRGGLGRRVYSFLQVKSKYTPNSNVSTLLFYLGKMSRPFWKPFFS